MNQKRLSLLKDTVKDLEDLGLSEVPWSFPHPQTSRPTMGQKENPTRPSAATYPTPMASKTTPKTPASPTAASKISTTKPSQKPKENGTDQNAKELKKIREIIWDCVRCKLSEKEDQHRFRRGEPKCRTFFRGGRAWARDEDLKGEPFVGRAGQLLTKMIEAMGYTRETIYIGNIVKCRPPENRYPEPDGDRDLLSISHAADRRRQTQDHRHFRQPRHADSPANQTRHHRTPRAVFRFSRYETHAHVSSRVSPQKSQMKRPCWEDLQQVMKFLEEAR